MFAWMVIGDKQSLAAEVPASSIQPRPKDLGRQGCSARKWQGENPVMLSRAERDIMVEYFHNQGAVHWFIQRSEMCGFMDRVKTFPLSCIFCTSYGTFSLI